MPIGKYKEKTLLEIKSIDAEYLRWAVKNTGGSIARRINEALTDNMESIKTIIPRCL